MADLAVVRAVKSSELPKVLVNLVLEYANWTIAQYREYCMRHIERITQSISFDSWYPKVPYGWRIAHCVLTENSSRWANDKNHCRLNNGYANHGEVFMTSCLVPNAAALGEWEMALARNLSENKAGIPHNSHVSEFRRKLRAKRDLELAAIFNPHR